MPRRTADVFSLVGAKVYRYTEVVCAPLVSSQFSPTRTSAGGESLFSYTILEPALRGLERVDGDGRKGANLTRLPLLW